MMMMDDPNIKDAEFQNHLYGCVCNNVRWTCFEVCFGVKVGFDLRI